MTPATQKEKRLIQLEQGKMKVVVMRQAAVPYFIARMVVPRQNKESQHIENGWLWG